MLKQSLAVFALVGGLMAAPVAIVHADESPAAETANAAQFSGPVLITDAGQGNTARMVEMMLTRAGGVDATRDDTAPVDALTEDHGALIIGVGASSKGLGAAGLDANAELARVRALIEKAKANNQPIIGVHIGGAARRGELSDGFNQLVAENATVMVVWNASDEDGFFKQIAERTGTRLIEVAQRPASGEAIASLFKKESDGE